MSLSMYDASNPLFIRFLGNLSIILDKAIAYADHKKMEPSALPTARLAPDMFTLTRQIQIASDIAKGCAARLAGMEVPAYADNEITLQDLKARLAKTIEFIQSIKATDTNGSENREINLKVGGKDMQFNGQSYLLGFALPNFYFHITTSYAILRHNGLEIGKSNFLGTL